MLYNFALLYNFDLLKLGKNPLFPLLIYIFADFTVKTEK